MYPVKPTWRLDTKLYKLSSNISPNNPIHCIDRILSGLTKRQTKLSNQPYFLHTMILQVLLRFLLFFHWLMAKYQIRKTQNDVTGQSLIVRIAIETCQSKK